MLLNSTLFTIIYLILLSPITVFAEGWTVDCNNYCSFNEFPNHCQGVYYTYTDGTRSYSTWSSQYNGCHEKRYEDPNPQNWGYHVLTNPGSNCSCPTNTIVLPAETTPMTQATRDKLELLREQYRNKTSCAPDPAFHTGDIFNEFSYFDVKTCKQFKSLGKKPMYFSLSQCEVGLFPSKRECKYNGDTPGSTFTGCLTGDLDRCYDIRDSQDPISGAWYRNAFKRRHPETSYGAPTFSRDHASGVMGYLIQTRDKPRALLWLNFLKNNPKHNSMFNICPPRPSIPKPAQISQDDWDSMLPDDRCHLVPTFAGFIYRVMKYIGISDSEINAIDNDLYSTMVLYETMVEDTLEIESYTSPPVGGPAYRTTLIADEVHMLRKMGYSSSKINTAATNAYERSGKIQPRFHFLAMGNQPTEYGAYLVQKYCRAPRPWYGYWASSGNTVIYNNPTASWYAGHNIESTGFQYFGSINPYNEREIDIGFECLMWLNLYLGNNSQNKTMKCDAGETLVDNACYTVPFQKAVILPIAGMDYRVGWPNSEVHYSNVNLNQCISGGTFENGDPTFTIWGPNLCKISNIIPTNIYKPGKNYFIDPSALYPGVYTYKNPAGGCDTGETLINGNCRAYSFATANPNLLSGVNYWVDNNPSSPGVYYAKIGGLCPYGGTPTGSNCKLYAAPSGQLRTDRSYFIRRNAMNPGIYHYPILVDTTIRPRSNTASD